MQGEADGCVYVRLEDSKIGQIIFAGYGMGPIFGGMLLSGKKAAVEVDKLLSKQRKGT